MDRLESIYVSITQVLQILIWTVLYRWLMTNMIKGVELLQGRIRDKKIIIEDD